MPKPHKNSIVASSTRRDLHVGRPNVGDREIFDRFVDQIFERRWFTNFGVVVREFERRLEDHLQVKHCIAVCNATIGLQVALKSMELTGEVILPSFTFAATAHAVAWSHLQTVFCDVNPETHCLCPEQVESLITPRTSAILGVHLWGQPCDPIHLQKIADARGLSLLFDSAHAFHSSLGERTIGGFGDCEVFSFHATKFFNTFEGGAITTNNDQLAERIRRRINFGFEGQDNIGCVGINAKMAEINAAMGISMFPMIEEFAEHNRRCTDVYRHRMHELPGLKMLTCDEGNRSNYQYAVVEVDESAFGCSRDQIAAWLVRNRVFAKRYFYPGCHHMEPYAEKFRETGRTLPVTDRLCRSTFCLPMGGAITLNEVEEVCDLIVQLQIGVSGINSQTVTRKAAS
jgi:dTDP-4-amino-4,6-dideoxygalactose transaminase